MSSKTVIILVWIHCIISSLARNVRYTPLKVDQSLNAKWKDFNALKDDFTTPDSKGKTPKWAKIMDSQDLYTLQNMMTTSIYYIKQKDKRTFGAFLYGLPSDAKTYGDSQRTAIESEQGYTGMAVTDKDYKKNPGRLLVDNKGKPAQDFSFKEGKVALYINLCKTNADKYGVGEGWYWAWVKPTDDLKALFGVKGGMLKTMKGPIMFALRETPLKPYTAKAAPAPPAALGTKPMTPPSGNTGTPPSVVQKKKKGIFGGLFSKKKTEKARIDYYDELEGDEYYDQDYDDLDYEYQQLLREEKALDRLLKEYGEDD